MSEKARAIVQYGYQKACEAFRETGRQFNLPVEENESRLVILYGQSTVTVTDSEPTTSLEIETVDSVGMQLMRDGLTSRFKRLGLDVQWEGRIPTGRPANVSLATVRQVQQISPSFIRVVIEGPDLARFAKGGLHFRLLLGPADAGWPGVDESGVTKWPGGVDNWHRPVYTTRNIEIGDNESATIEFDVFLHDGGRVTEWVRGLSSGTQIAISGPGGGRGPEHKAWVVLIGDETAVPVIARSLRLLPEATRGEVVLFVPHPEDIQELEHPDSVKVNWKLRGSGGTPFASLQSVDIPEKDRFVFFAAERSEVFAARDYLLQSGLDKSEFFTSTYWTAPSIDGQD